MQRSRVWYRTSQVLRHLRGPEITAADEAFVRALLPPALQALFGRQQVGDQAHAIAVCRDLQAAGHQDWRLLQAALLHDVGKSLGISLLARIALTLLKKVAPSVLDRVAEPFALCQRAIFQPASVAPGSPWRRFRRALSVSLYHPALGAEMAAAAGADPDVVALIRHHQGEGLSDAHLAPLLRALQTVDDAH